MKRRSFFAVAFAPLLAAFPALARVVRRQPVWCRLIDKRQLGTCIVCEWCGFYRLPDDSSRCPDCGILSARTSTGAFRSLLESSSPSRYDKLPPKHTDTRIYTRSQGWILYDGEDLSRRVHLILNPARNIFPSDTPDKLWLQVLE